MMKNWLLAELLSPRARHADDAALERHVGELGLQVRIFRAAGAVAVLAVAGLRHEAGDHAVERHVVVEVLARELLEALGVLGREVVAQLDDDAAVLGVDEEGVLRIERRPASWLRDGGSGTDQGGEDGEASGSWKLPVQRPVFAGEFRFQPGRDRRRHEGDTSPPMDGDLPHQCGGDRADRRAGRQEHRLHVGRHRAVHARPSPSRSRNRWRLRRPRISERRALAPRGGRPRDRQR